MSGSRIPVPLWCISILSIIFYVWTPPADYWSQSAQESSAQGKDKAAPPLPRGQKLILKDGTYQLTREYQRSGDRVRYFSTERGDWEELPASLVDWDATAKAAGEDEKFAAAMVEKAHKQEEAKRMDNVTDVDASLPVGDGAFLPSGEGLFVVEGKSVRMLDQVGAGLKTDKKREIEKVLSPIQIVPGKKNLSIPGAHATVRLKSKTPEFYLREPPPDPDRVSKVLKSSRPDDRGPDVELIRAKVTRNARQVESMRSLFGEVISMDRDVISMQRWEVAPSVYRYTLSQGLEPGEYVVAELLPDGLNYFVWDFGVDAAGPAGSSK